MLVLLTIIIFFWNSCLYACPPLFLFFVYHLCTVYMILGKNQWEMMKSNGGEFLSYRLAEETASTHTTISSLYSRPSLTITTTGEGRSFIPVIDPWAFRVRQLNNPKLWLSNSLKAHEEINSERWSDKKRKALCRLICVYTQGYATTNRPSADRPTST